MRRAGVLLHPTSLPGPGPCGDLGREALRFLDWLAESGCTLWQTLPLNPAGGGFSPYGSPSSFAGAPHLISVDQLVLDGLLSATELIDRPYSPGRVDLDGLERWHTPLTERAALRLAREEPKALERLAEEEPALADWALFEAIRRSLGVNGWWDFPEPLRERDPDALKKARDQLEEAVTTQLGLQILFRRQWSTVRAAAAAREIQIVGDLPIFVAGDGCDTWRDRGLFRWAEDSETEGWRPDPVSGAPPDDFTALGQRWGNPLYSWPAHEADGFQWWISRFRAALSLVDLLRVDHFRGFAAAWEIPADAQDARAGRWGKSPGAALFAAVAGALGDVPIIAEDLGVITPDVEALRQSLGVPGMKVLQFAFGQDATHAYLPHNYPDDICVAYTGTHDTDTAVGWYHTAPPAAQHRYRVYAGRDGAEPGWDFIRLAWGSIARWAIAPLQDVLNLDGYSRMNTPGLARGNWLWRAHDLPPDAAHRLHELCWVYGR